MYYTGICTLLKIFLDSYSQNSSFSALKHNADWHWISLSDSWKEGERGEKAEEDGAMPGNARAHFTQEHVEARVLDKRAKEELQMLG